MMDFAYYLEKIQLPSEAREIFWAIHRRCENETFVRKLTACIEAYDQGDAVFGGALQSFAEAEQLTPETLNLYVYLRMSEKRFEDYRARGIDESIFYESMYAMTVCSRVCFDLKGFYGIEQTRYRGWQRYVMNGELFRLGRLEFQMRTFDEAITVDGVTAPAGSTVLSVHVPRYAPLSEEACEKSYERAREFFRKYYGIAPCVFVCESWLLHPWMQEYLPETSSILRFQKKFKLLSMNQNAPEVARWVFPGYEEKEIAEYPTDTSLRRAVIDRMQSGLPIGTAFGVRL